MYSSSYKRIRVAQAVLSTFLSLSQENSDGLKAPSHSIDTSGGVQLECKIESGGCILHYCRSHNNVLVTLIYLAYSLIVVYTCRGHD